jgi:hypothetical protein
MVNRNPVAEGILVILFAVVFTLFRLMPLSAISCWSL